MKELMSVALIAASLALAPALTSQASAQQSFTVVTYNTFLGSNPQAQMQHIAALTPQPDVVVLQEVQVSAVATYESLLDAAYSYPGPTWQGYTFPHQRSDPANGCSRDLADGEGIIILTRLPVVDFAGTLVYAPDEWWCKRGLGRVRIQAPGGTVDVFGYHAPISPDGRDLLLSAFRSWSSGSLVDRLVGGDFNDTPAEPTIALPTGMTSDYYDAWVRSSAVDPSGYDGMTIPAGAPNRRIDYWFSNKASTLTPSDAKIIYPSDSDHRALAMSYTFGTAPPPTNLALNKPTTVSSVETTYIGANAVDGNMSTRWGSAFSDPQWIYVDLGARYTLNRVALHWELAYAVAYKLQVSDNAATWRDVYSTTNNSSTENTITSFTGDPSGRFLRIYCTVRTFVYGAQWGYSLWEIEANGTPAGSPDVVLYATDVPDTNLHGNWTKIPDSTAAAGTSLSSTDYGGPVLTAAAAPTDYLEAPVQVIPGIDYHVWLRVRAAGNNKFNDSLFVQFSNSTYDGAPKYRIGTSDALLVNLASDAGATSLVNWGWEDGAYWLPQPSVLRFDSSSATIRIQIREDGVSFDQIVLSPSRYLTSPPGGITDDHTIVPK